MQISNIDDVKAEFAQIIKDTQDKIHQTEKDSHKEMMKYVIGTPEKDLHVDMPAVPESLLETKPKVVAEKFEKAETKPTEKVMSFDDIHKQMEDFHTQTTKSFGGALGDVKTEIDDLMA